MTADTSSQGKNNVGVLWWKVLHPDFATEEAFFCAFDILGAELYQRRGNGSDQTCVQLLKALPLLCQKKPHFCSWEIQGSIPLLPAEIWHVWTQTRSGVCLGKAPVLTPAILLTALHFLLTAASHPTSFLAPFLCFVHPFMSCLNADNELSTAGIGSLTFLHQALNTMGDLILDSSSRHNSNNYCYYHYNNNDGKI